MDPGLGAGSRFRPSLRLADRTIPVGRRPFLTSDATIVVSPNGYFDVFAPGARAAHVKPSYRGVIAELGPTVRVGDRLSVRPDSSALLDAVNAWSSERGAAAVRGELGAGRDHKANPVPVGGAVTA